MAETNQTSDVRIPKDLEEKRRQQRQALLAAQSPSEQEQRTQQTADNLLSSQSMGIAKVQDQPIAMPFIRGQSAGIRRQTQAQLEPLQRRLARLQSQRQQQQNVAQTQLGFTQQDIQQTRQQQQRQADIQREEKQQQQQSLRERQQQIRSIADDARQRGASAEVVNAILAAETAEQALGAAASVAPVQPEEEERFETRSIAGGGILELEKDPQTGEIVNTRVVRSPTSSGNGGDTQIDQNTILETVQELDATRGEDDGHVNTADYVSVFQEWLNRGGTIESFKENFPPEDYVNPNDPTVPTILKPEEKSNSSGSGRSVL